MAEARGSRDSGPVFPVRDPAIDAARHASPQRWEDSSSRIADGCQVGFASHRRRQVLSAFAQLMSWGDPAFARLRTGIRGWRAASACSRAAGEPGREALAARTRVL
jgi:hypothetical protein